MVSLYLNIYIDSLIFMKELSKRGKKYLEIEFSQDERRKRRAKQVRERVKRYRQRNYKIDWDALISKE